MQRVIFHFRLFAARALWAGLGMLVCMAHAQQPSAAKEQAPRTAPQVEQVLPLYEGQKVVAVEVAGRPDLNQEQLMPLVKQKPGTPFSNASVHESIAALKQAGAAKEVEAEVRPEGDGIRILLVLQPAYYFGIYEFPGAERFPYSRLLQVADYPPRGVYNLSDVERTRELLIHFFQQNGYFQAEVKNEIKTLPDRKLVNVEFRTSLKRRAKFGKVILSGVPAGQEQALQKALRSWIARLRGSAIRPGKNYSLRTVQNATQYLEGQLIKRKYLGSRVQVAGAEYDPATRRADVRFEITPGDPVVVKIQGAHVWSRTQRKLLPIYQQAGLDPELIQEGRRNLISHFQSKGFFNVTVQSSVEAQGKTTQVLYTIVKGPRHKVADVDIAGNKTLSTKELMDHVKVQEAHIPFFSHGSFSDALERTSVNNLKKLYQSEGFSSVEVTPQVSDANGKLTVRFRVNEGPRDVVDSLRLEGNTTVPEDVLAPKGLMISEGQPYSGKKVNHDRSQIVAQYLRMGYLNASFRATARQVNNQPHRLAVLYTITEGPRVLTGSVITLGRRVTRQSLIDKTVRLKTEQPMREDELFAAESRLYELNAFDWAEIDPRRQITTQTEEDVVVKVHESRRNELKYGFGFEVINRGGSIPGGTVALPNLPPVGLPSSFQTSEKTFWGPRGTVQYTRHNFLGLAQTITVSALGARLVQRGSASWADPHFIGTDWTSNLALSGERNSENPIFTSRLGDFDFQVQHPLNPDDTQQITLRYSLRQTRLSNLLIPDLVPVEDQSVRLSTLAASYARDTRDRPLDASKGIYETAEFEINPSVLGSSVDFARLRAQVAYYKKIPAGIVWANSVRIGLEQPFAGSHVPLSELFFSGGGSTLRGFPLNGAGPQREIPACGNPADTSTCTLIRVPVGGRELLILNSELRIPLPIKKGLGMAVFYDGGNVFQHLGFRDFGSSYTNTVGLGLRYSTPVGPIRVDVGRNLNPLSGIKATQIFVTLGQAF